MAYKITDKCTACGSCKESCPAEAIKEGEKQYTIDAETCIDCGVCVDTCPVKAIVEG
jgi:formate hydrogenlyase subunit 6/NADH:ubiquinone oxidoreductase subunit I